MRIATVLVLLLAIVAADAQSPRTDAEFKTVHLFNLRSAGDEEKLLALLRQFNDLFAKLGQPGIRYRVWKVAAAEARGGTRYIWESTWPNRAIYEKIHNLPDYKSTFERLSPEIARLMSEHIYNQYVELK
jgi:hypothetical protein